MATNSILRSIKITTKNDAKKLINALEGAEKRKSGHKKATIQKMHVDATKDDIQSIFGAKQVVIHCKDIEQPDLLI